MECTVSAGMADGDSCDLAGGSAMDAVEAFSWPLAGCWPDVGA